FLGQKDYESVLERVRLANGAVWPMPIMLNVAKAFGDTLKPGTRVALRDPEGTMLAVLTVGDVFGFDWKREAQAVFGTTDTVHPHVKVLSEMKDQVYVGGTLQGTGTPNHYDFKVLRHTPAELRHEFTRLGWQKVCGFQTRNPLHRAHKEMTVRAATEAGAHLLLNPSVGMTKPGDIDHYTRVRCYEAIGVHYPPGMMKLALLPLAMRMGGPREALWHAIIRKNHGCSHFIVGRDHAGPGNDSKGKPFYGPYDAQKLVDQYQKEVGIQMVPFQEMVYVKSKAQYLPMNEVGKDEEIMNISGTEQRRRLREGLEIPEWFTYPNVVEVLRKAYPPKSKQGFTLFFTGFSGSGKSTIAQVLLSKFLELGGRPVTLLDGDIVRKNLSAGLGFSKEDRDRNIVRIGFVANEITKNGGIAICAPIAPYAAPRKANRDLISANGAYIEIHVATPIEECEKRDRKGLYAKARAGLVQQFTGINDPYEAPEKPEIRLDTTHQTPAQSADEVWLYLEREGYLA
ncbi:MAG TPA: bifunctional sulfate adenylyltransferase/adenylylsulfate kinase, partial [bacterium]